MGALLSRLWAEIVHLFGGPLVPVSQSYEGGQQMSPGGDMDQSMDEESSVDESEVSDAEKSEEEIEKMAEEVEAVTHEGQGSDEEKDNTAEAINDQQNVSLSESPDEKEKTDATSKSPDRKSKVDSGKMVKISPSKSNWEEGSVRPKPLLDGKLPPSKKTRMEDGEKQPKAVAEDETAFVTTPNMQFGDMHEDFCPQTLSPEHLSLQAPELEKMEEEKQDSQSKMEEGENRASGDGDDIKLAEDEIEAGDEAVEFEQAGGDATHAINKSDIMQNDGTDATNKNDTLWNGGTKESELGNGKQEAMEDSSNQKDVMMSDDVSTSNATYIIEPVGHGTSATDENVALDSHDVMEQESNAMTLETPPEEDHQTLKEGLESRTQDTEGPDLENQECGQTLYDDQNMENEDTGDMESAKDAQIDEESLNNEEKSSRAPLGEQTQLNDTSPVKEESPLDLSLNKGMNGGTTETQDENMENIDPNRSVPQKMNQVSVQWSGEAQEVYVTGSWLEWKGRVELHETERNIWAANLSLDPELKEIEMKFIVDGNWVISPDMPWKQNEMGSQNNYIKLLH